MVKKLFGLVLAISMACPTVSFAQGDAHEGHGADRAGVRVRLALTNHDSITATVLSVDDAGLVARDISFGTHTLTVRSAPGWGPGVSRMSAADIVSVVVLDSRKPTTRPSTEGPEAGLARRIAGQLAPGSTIDVRTRDGKSRRVKFLGGDPDGFQVALHRGIATVAYTDVTAIGPAGMSGLKKGILGALGIYAAVGTVVLIALAHEL